MRPLAVLRPEPGNAATCARIVSAGAVALPLPLFVVHALAWTPPDADDFDALLLTSANAVRHGGAALHGYAHLPVYAVGSATAAAAEAAGLTVTGVGGGDAAEIAALMVSAGITRTLHLAGRDRSRDDLPNVTATVAVYASEVVPLSADALLQLAGSVALIHSPRAGARLAEAAPDPAMIRVAAISPAALTAARAGWAATIVADDPTDAALIAAALSLAD